MRHITALPPLKVFDIHGKPANDGKPLSLSEFITHRLGDAVFGKNMQNVLSAVRIQQRLLMLNDPAQPELHLEESDWKLLKQAVETPSAPYNALVAPALAPFMVAVTEARDST